MAMASLDSSRSPIAADRLLDRRKARGADLVGELLVDPARPGRAAVDEAGVGLDQRRAGADPLPGVVGGLDAADRDQRDSIAEPDAQPAQHRERAGRERRAGPHAAPGAR